MRDPPDGYHVRGPRVLLYVVRGDPAGDLDHDLGAPGLELAVELPGLARGEVVQHDDVGAALEGRESVLPALDLYLHLLGEARRPGPPERLPDAPRDPDVVVLDEYAVVEAEPVWVPAPERYRPLLELPEARHGLPRRGDPDIRAVLPAPVDQVAGHGRDAAHPHDEVQGEPLARQERPRGAGDGEHDVPLPDHGAVLALHDGLRTQPLEHLAGLGGAGEHAPLLRADAPPGLQAGWDYEFGRDVPGADVLGEELVHLRAHARKSGLGPNKCIPVTT